MCLYSWSLKFSRKKTKISIWIDKFEENCMCEVKTASFTLQQVTSQNKHLSKYIFQRWQFVRFFFFMILSSPKMCSRWQNRWINCPQGGYISFGLHPHLYALTAHYIFQKGSHSSPAGISLIPTSGFTCICGVIKGSGGKVRPVWVCVCSISSCTVMFNSWKFRLGVVVVIEMFKKVVSSAEEIVKFSFTWSAEEFL